MTPYEEIDTKIKDTVSEEWDFKIIAKIRRYWQIHIWKKGYFQYKRIFSVHCEESLETTKRTVEVTVNAIDEDIRRDIKILENLADISTRW